MQPWRLALVLHCYWTLCYAQLSYYVDSSCANADQFWLTLDDTIEFADITFDRITDAATDDAFSNAFKTLFHVDLMSPDMITVPLLSSFTAPPQGFMRSVFGAFKDMVGTRYQNPSYLRFYCDNDAHDSPTARYQLVPDRADDPIPNSLKKLNVDQEWFDQYNYMRLATSNPFPCQYKDPQNPNWKIVAHVTRMAIYDKDFTYNGNPLPDDMQQDRSVITLCDYAFDTTAFPYRAFQDLPMPLDLNTITLASDVFRKIISATLIHELTHIRQFGTADVKGFNSFGWENCVGMEGIDAFRNAENYMYLALLASLEQCHYILSPDPEDAANGVLIYTGP